MPGGRMVDLPCCLPSLHDMLWPTKKGPTPIGIEPVHVHVHAHLRPYSDEHRTDAGRRWAALSPSRDQTYALCGLTGVEQGDRPGECPTYRCLLRLLTCLRSPHCDDCRDEARASHPTGMVFPPKTLCQAASLLWSSCSQTFEHILGICPGAGSYALLVKVGCCPCT